jgi:PIN domain nuclease of toxin-antitoxin system
VRLLLDTHAFLWFILDDPRLSAKADALISDSNNEIEISPAAYWEIAIKISIGKYSLPEPYEVFVEREITTNDFRILHIEPRHAAVASALPFHHRDPFDGSLSLRQWRNESLSSASIRPSTPTTLRDCGSGAPAPSRIFRGQHLPFAASPWTTRTAILPHSGLDRILAGGGKLGEEILKSGYNGSGQVV